ncbi:hypothetical protein HK104_007139, partial [Borealophlyctis nickersoniae]
VRMINLTKLQESQRWSVGANATSCISLSPSGQYLAVGVTGNAPYPELGDPLNSPDPHYGDGIVRVFDVRTVGRDSVLDFDTGMDDHNIVGFSPCERYIYATADPNENGDVPATLVYDVRWPRDSVLADRGQQSKVVHKLPHVAQPDDKTDREGIGCAVWTQTGFLMTGGMDSCVRIWDPRRGDPLVRVLDGHEAPVCALTLSDDESFLAVGTNTSCVYLWSLLDREYCA